MDLNTSRRDLLLASLTAALPLGLSLNSSDASASPLDPAQTIIKLPGDLTWKANPANPPRSSESCVLTGDPTAAGLYYTLVRWWPGYMSAPHTYTSDRFCVVVSGTHADLFLADGGEEEVVVLGVTEGIFATQCHDASGR